VNNLSGGLKEEATGIIEELGLLRSLRSFGRAEVVGSVALGLIGKLDIDIPLLVDDADLVGVVNRIYPKLLEHGLVSEVRISDYRPQGVKIGINRVPAKSGIWSIDLWVTDKLEETAFSYVQEMLNSLTGNHREIILELKRHYHDQRRLRDGMSYRIYQAVTKKGVKTIEEFEKTNVKSPQ